MFSLFDRSCDSNLVYGFFIGAELKITLKSNIKEFVLRNFNLKFLKSGESKGKHTVILVVISGKSRHEAAKKALKIAF